MSTATPTGEYWGEWELYPHELATLFAYKGWMYATRTLGYGYPSPDAIEILFRELVDELREDGREDVIARRGRFLAVRHSETGGSVDLYLNIGHIWVETNDEED